MVLEVRLELDEVVLTNPRPFEGDPDAVAEDFESCPVPRGTRQTEERPGDQDPYGAGTGVIAVIPQADLSVSRVRPVIVGREDIRRRIKDMHQGGIFSESRRQ